MTKLYDEATFEREILKIAGNIFSPLLRKKENYIIEHLDQRERDGYFEGEFVVHCIEITVSKKSDKTLSDLRKIEQSIRYYEEKFRGTKSIRGMFVTLHPLTPDQFRILKTFSTRIQHEDYHTFLSRLIDTQRYLKARENYNFGSIQEQINKNIDDTFIETKFFDKNNRKKPLPLRTLTANILKGICNKIIIEGDFGTGKSVSGRKIFLKLASDHIKGLTKRFPVYLNLRDFAELESGDEALRRHAQRIGLSDMGDQLVRAWKAGYISLIIDGYDEVIPRISARQTKRIKDIKHQSLAVLRSIIRGTDNDTPIMILGRSNFFSSEKEMSDSLGVDATWNRFHLDDFDEIQARQLSRKFGYSEELPSWLPRKPLLIAYFLDMLVESGKLGDAIDSSEGWRELLNKVCEREISQIDKIPLIKDELIEIYGRLSLVARKRVSEVGPISVDDMRSIYKDMFHEDPEGAALGQLLRIPFLVHTDRAQIDHIGNSLENSSAKNFVSKDLVDIASAILIHSTFQSGRHDCAKLFKSQRHCLGEDGVKALIELFDGDAVSMSDAVRFFNGNSADNVAQVDLIMAIDNLNERYSGPQIRMEGLDLKIFQVDGNDTNISKIQITNSYFEKIIIDRNVDSKSEGPYFDNCIIEQVETNSRAICSSIFSEDCHVEDYIDREQNSNSYLRMNLNEETKIICTILQKVYIQSTNGRMEGALKRGMSPTIRPKVDEAIDVLKKGHIIEPARVDGEIRWHPIRKMRGEVLEFLEEPSDAKIRKFKRNKTG